MYIKLGLPKWITCFLKEIISKWNLEVKAGLETFFSKNVERGILQGDSLSPLLFVLCIDPLSRRLNERYSKVVVHAEEALHATNHFLFIDDLKLFSKDSIVMGSMVEEAESFFSAIGLEINRDKSATNDPLCEETARLLNDAGVYKYPGIIENRGSNIARESFEKVKREMIMRDDRLCNSNLNAKNLFKAINEHAISLINHHVGLQYLEPADFAAIDQKVRLSLIKHNVHLKPGCKEKLYHPQNKMGRNFHSVEMKSECMLLELWETLEKYKNISSIRTAILKVMEQEKTHLSIINQYFKLRYSLEDVSVKSVINAQRDSLYGKINNKKLHEELYRAHLNEHINLKDSSTWMTHGNKYPRADALYCYIQDRNVFWGETAPSCQHCGQAKKTIDQLATGCDRILGMIIPEGIMRC
ncbi:Retrovirus-related Pol polyprotein from type-2 retrotransposable element R2DM [Astathelohania contejeani]|uniref:Retrovirus-related Pol polyprotein from type-2 retrotransposable element R2DM n=1 Tax=Astathelohania contejeani TaxID=164912 RepID=A0ABQ7HX92_9MICR|nr:Retrovirus-related Pol polyprotein from type-2 retrotransposable element R2DM [Thelohania contejeani]